ncbi:MAG: prohibitin family protein [Oscillospiraceae bacterium]|jgi:regulator of protease activity HflC (stomatin/prohibitin superfamily)|nr:prohibitin family protein [Oscillospiraceae bacterium]
MALFVIGIVVTLALFLALGITYGTKVEWKLNKKQLLSVLGVGIMVLACYVSVPTGHTGVVTTFGKVENFTLEAGVHFKLPWQEVVKMDNRVQKSTLDMSCFSSDIQEVTMKYTVNYQISKQDAMTIYKTIGTDYYNTVIAPCITEAVKIVTARYNAEALISSRSNMAGEIETELEAKLLDYNIELVGTSIEDMDFTDAFTDAVEAKQVAEQNKLRAETEAEQRVIEANAAAEIRKVEADAAAYQTLTRAEAEAKANREIAESLTQALIDYTYAQTWDGKLPTFMTGENGILPFMNVDKMVEESTEPEPTEPVTP